VVDRVIDLAGLKQDSYRWGEWIHPIL
jgi:hypothetical protein